MDRIVKTRTLFILAFLAAFGGVHADPALPAQDRYAQVFDRGADAGKLTARFLRLESADLSQGADKAGDATILTSPDGKVMVIDAGAVECGAQVVRALRELGAEKIDILVASHPHVDHIGGLPEVISAFPVERIYLSRVEYPTGPYRRFMEAARSSGAAIEYLAEGDAFAFGQSVDVRVFNPERDIRYYDGYPENSTQFVNDKSLVLKFRYGSSSMLFMGDVYLSRELDLVEKFGAELKADVIKEGHHGSDTSSGKTFVRTVAPKIAVAIHDGVASRSVYRNYRKVGAAAYITFLDGDVKVAGDDSGSWTTLTRFDRTGDFLD
jgi:competence protein ComEC